MLREEHLGVLARQLGSKGVIKCIRALVHSCSRVPVFRIHYLCSEATAKP